MFFQTARSKIRSFFTRPTSRRRSTASLGRPRGFRPRIEPLEDRRLLAVALVEDVKPGAVGSDPRLFVGLDDALVFAASGAPGRVGLWRATPDAPGVEFLGDVTPPGQASLFSSEGTRVGDAAFFTMRGTMPGQESFVRLWKSDGDSSRPVLVRQLADFNPRVRSRMKGAGGLLYFTGVFDQGRGNEIWRSDGTSSGTYMLRDIRPGAGPGISSSDPEMAAVGDTLYFAANDGVRGFELWKTNGTASGTVLVEDIALGPGSSHPEDLTASGELLFFSALDAGGERTLWRTDGTKAGTRVVDENIVLPDFVSSQTLIDVNGLLYFVVSAAGQQRELWRTDGSAEGTTRVSPVRLGGKSIVPTFINVDRALFFLAADESGRWELWETDAAADGVKRVAQLPAETSSFTLRQMTTAGALFFQLGDQLWRSDGTEAGTTLIAETSIGREAMVGVGQVVYFVGYDGQHGAELWSVFRTPGDANYDDRVDLVDLNQVRNNFGAVGSALPGDANGDGAVDVTDLNLVRNNFGVDYSLVRATDDLYQTDEDVPLVVEASHGLLTNDFSERTGSLSAEILQPPRRGQVVVDGDGSFVYTPARDFMGTDTFRYVAVVGDEASTGDASVVRSLPASVRIIVAPINNAPRAVDQEFATFVDEALASVDVGPAVEVEPNDAPERAQRIDQLFSLRNDPDIAESATVPHATILGRGGGAKDYYRFTVDLASISVPAWFDIDTAGHGLFDAHLRLLAEDGELLADNDDSRLDEGAGGSSSTFDSFLAYVFDAPGEYVLEVGSCCVGPVPSGAEYRLHVSIPGHALISPTVLAGAFDADGDPLSVFVVENVSHGELILANDGTFSYTPAAGFVGVDSFTYRVSDGTLESNLATVTITVHPAPARVLDRLQGASRSFGRKTALAVESNAAWDQALAELTTPPS